MTNPTDLNRSRQCRWQSIQLIVVLITVGLSCFASGYMVANRRLKDRICAEGLIRFQEFVVYADELGIINRERLDEVVAGNE